MSDFKFTEWGIYELIGDRYILHPEYPYKSPYVTRLLELKNIESKNPCFICRINETGNTPRYRWNSGLNEWKEIKKERRGCDRTLEDF